MIVVFPVEPDFEGIDAKGEQEEMRYNGLFLEPFDYFASSDVYRLGSCDNDKPSCIK